MSRHANKTLCHKCGAHIRNGLDNDALAFVARVDDERVTHNGELRAILNGRRTYSLEAGRLYRRHSHQLRKPATATYVEHRCWEMFPAEWLTPAKQKPTHSDTPLF